MAPHDGISIQDRWLDAPATKAAGKERLKPANNRCAKASRYFVRVWDPNLPAKNPGGKMGGYASKCFPTVTAGHAWAEHRRGEFLKGTASAHTTTMTEVGAAFMTSLRTRIDGAVTERHQAQVQQVIDGLVSAGARDITDPAFPDLVQRWLSGLQAQRTWQKHPRPASPGLKRKFLVIARAVMAYAQERRLVAYDPLAAIRTGRVEQKRKPIFTVDELTVLVSDTSRWKNRDKWAEAQRLVDVHHGNQKEAAKALGISPSTLHYRLNTKQVADPWWLVAVLLTYTGCRISEVLSMTPGMVDRQAGVLLLPANATGNKMKRDRRIRLQPELSAILVELMEGHSIGKNEPLVGSHMVNFTSANLSNGFKDYCRRCGIDPGPRGPHSLRHTFCALMTALGISPFLVMEMAGHTSAQVTRSYSQSAEELIDRVAAWPRNELGRFHLRR
jgi:integrase